MTRRAAVVLTLFVSSLLSAEALPGVQQREYPFSLPAIQAALKNLGAYQGSRLPSLEGFVVSKDVVDLRDYQRPYNEFKIDLTAKAANQTLVRVQANVSAWFVGNDPTSSGYRAFESTGRLEADLMDRLSDYLKNKSSDPEVLTKRIADVRTERKAVDERVQALEQQIQKLKDTPPPTAREFAIVARPSVSILSAPGERATVLLHPEADDEFAVLENRGAWLKVELDRGGSGWVKRSQVEVSSAVAADVTPLSVAAAPVAGFTVIREMTDDFNGDWARLRGKKALYLFAQPDGTIGEANRLKFVQSIFTERYREIAHGAGNPVDGIVVIFMDQRGAVAAASLDDIRLWTAGALSQAMFLKKCSFDPPGAFGISEAPARSGASKSPSTAQTERARNSSTYR